MHRYARGALVAGLLICAAPALAQNIVSPRTGGAPTISTTAKAVPASLSAADQATMAAASKESFFIMRASYLAGSKGSAAVKPLATELIGYHTQALSDFRGALLAAGLKPAPVSLNADQEKRLAALEAASGGAFDAAYKSEIVAAQTRASAALLAHGKTKGNLIVVAQANRQGNQILALNAKTKTR